MKILAKILFCILICILLGLSCIVGLWIYTGIDFAYPKGEISFIGLSQNQVIEKIDTLRVNYRDKDKILLAIDNGGSFFYFDKKEDVLKNKHIENSKTWGVNYQENNRVMYMQILLFDENNIVKSQTIKKRWDGT